MSRMTWIVGLLAAGLALPAQAASVRYVHTDALGSVVAKTDENRVVLERREYEPYGRQLVPSNVQDGPGYTGHVQDAATQLTYMQQRYYDPGIGMFLSVDPVTAYSNRVGLFHRYRYANNNPYKFTDPDGRCPEGSTKRTCIPSTTENPSAKDTAQGRRISDASRRARVPRGSRDEKIVATVRDPNSGKESSVEMSTSTERGGKVYKGRSNDPAPEGTVQVDHGHPDGTLMDDPNPGVLGDAQVIKDLGVPNVAIDSDGRQASHEVEDGRYQVRALPGTRFTNDEITFFEAVVNERQRLLDE